jgi:hypothetical protein
MNRCNMSLNILRLVKSIILYLKSRYIPPQKKLNYRDHGLINYIDIGSVVGCPINGVQKRMLWGFSLISSQMNPQGAASISGHTTQLYENRMKSYLSISMGDSMQRDHHLSTKCRVRKKTMTNWNSVGQCIRLKHGLIVLSLSTLQKSNAAR